MCYNLDCRIRPCLRRGIAGRRGEGKEDNQDFCMSLTNSEDGPTPKERDRNHKSHEVTEVAVTELQTKDFTDNTARKR